MPSLMSGRRQIVAEALQHLTVNDPVLANVIKRVGPFTMKLERDRFAMLVRSILSQQISTKAALSVRLKLEGMTSGEGLTPMALARLSDPELRSAGLSGQKTSYLRDLTSRVLDQRLNLDRLHRLSDEEIIAQLIEVRGIGVWTAQMFLMFSLGRLDVLPLDDLGIRSGLRKLHALEEQPGKKKCLELAAPWRPYATIASWYLWRFGELKNTPEQDAGHPPV